MSLLYRAIQFAAERHGAVNQRRKFTNDPYILHPLEVMGFHLTYTHDARFRSEEQLAAAVLHDVVEDTLHPSLKEGSPEWFEAQARLQRQIAFEFGFIVAQRVKGLTDHATKAMGNRAVRTKFEAERLWAEDEFVQTAKCFDLGSNSRTILQYDTGFARTYLPEKRYVLSGLDKADTGALYFARATLEAAEAELAALDARNAARDAALAAKDPLACATTVS